MTILFAFDGSKGADAALSAARKLFPGAGIEAVVLSIWEPMTVEAIRALRFGTPSAPVPNDPAEVDNDSEARARELAEHGARLAAELGYEARPVWIADTRDVAEAIVAAADDTAADLVVLGARGLTGVRALLGSVSNHVVQHARRPVLVVPPASDRHAFG